MAAFYEDRVSINVVDVELGNRVDSALELIPALNCALKEMKNATQKACAARVPKEVFDEILVYALRVAPVAVRVNGHSDLGWVKLSHVCRSWRRFAITFEYAWASSIGQLPLATDVFVKRAGATLLTAEMTGECPLLPSPALAYTPADEASATQVLRNLRFSRFKSVRVADGRVRASLFAMELCTQSMVDPLMHLADLVLEDLPWTLSRDDTENLGRGVLSLHAPNLETLRLQNCFFDFACGNLRALEISFDGFSTPRPHTVAIVTALAGSPNVRSIKILDAINTDVLVDLTGPDPSALVLLQSLDHLDVSGPALPIGELLAGLAFPQSTSVRVNAWLSSESVTGPLRRITEALHENLFQNFSTIAVDNNPRFGVEVTRVRMWVEGDISCVGRALRFGDSADGEAPIPRIDWLFVALSSLRYRPYIPPTMSNAVVIYPNEPALNLGPALRDRDTVTSLMRDIALPSSADGHVDEKDIAAYLNSREVRQICAFFNPKRTIYWWNYTMYGAVGENGLPNEVASVVQKTGYPGFKGPVIVMKDAPVKAWKRLDTSISAKELAAAIWTYHKTGLDAAQCIRETGVTISSRVRQFAAAAVAQVKALLAVLAASVQVPLAMSPKIARSKKRSRTDGDVDDFSTTENLPGVSIECADKIEGSLLEQISSPDTLDGVVYEDEGAVPIPSNAEMASALASASLVSSALSESAERSQDYIEEEESADHGGQNSADGSISATNTEVSRRVCSGEPLGIKKIDFLDEKCIQRVRNLAVYCDEKEAIFAIRKLPADLQWNSSSVKDSALVVAGMDSPVSVWVVGQLSFNGMIPSGRSSGMPAIASVSLDPIVEGDVAKIRDAVVRYSSNGAPADNLKTFRASRNMSYRKREVPDIQISTFGNIRDARNGDLDIDDMPYLDPSFLMKGDVVLVEASIGRFKDPKSKDWGKSRVTFNLECVFLLANMPSAGSVGVSPAKKLRRLG
ncbi:hypothetical protein K488DRAFT_88276 [Vararia minispora EC-137]|uniref:Uncharacterized protein n=1 Tax=Vararia minispora EC-137 TaxID=1314806 RepID=A0ACB8QE20_9AGAM|nr:hypothetical protein K488DRAFT_88276 [Vararia minispora EC-137]